VQQSVYFFNARRRGSYPPRHITHSQSGSARRSSFFGSITSRLRQLNHSSINIRRLQTAQNLLVRTCYRAAVICRLSTFCIQELHWLPIHSPISFRLASITYKTLSTNQPIHLSSLLDQYSNTIRYAPLISIFLTGLASTQTAPLPFSYKASNIWNNLHLSVRHCTFQFLSNIQTSS